MLGYPKSQWPGSEIRATLYRLLLTASRFISLNPWLRNGNIIFVHITTNSKLTVKQGSHRLKKYLNLEDFL